MSNLMYRLRKVARKNHFLRVILGHYLPATGIYDRYFKTYKVSALWRARIKDVLNCQDNAKIPRVNHAGAISKGRQIMHNGVRVNVGSYYGPEVARLLVENKGVHEPQEEYVFQEILKELPAHALMVELGSFWAFYSIWFARSIDAAQNYMIEPDRFNIISGKRNFKLNGLHGDFTNAFVGEKSQKEGDIRTVCIDDFVEEKNIDHIHLLHSDIQGAELQMLKGARKGLEKNIIDYIFISTHSDELHYACIDLLKSNAYTIIVEADLKNTFSEDGLIVAKSSKLKSSTAIQIDHKKNHHKKN